MSRMSTADLLKLPRGAEALGLVTAPTQEPRRGPHTWQCVIPGEPVGKGRPRFVKATGRTYTPAKTAAWEIVAADEMRDRWQRKPLTCGCKALVVAVFRRPKSRKAGSDHVVRPDADNVAKAAMDAAEKAGVLANDSQAWHVTAVKRYVKEGESPCVIVALSWEEL